MVVVFDGLATEPCAYKVAVDFEKMGEQEVDYLAKKLRRQGATCWRSAASPASSSTTTSSKGIHDDAAKESGIKIVGSVHGNWTQTVAQKEVAGILPTLPEIKAVVDQGGDG